MSQPVVDSGTAGRVLRTVLGGLLLVVMGACGSISQQAEPKADDFETVRADGFSALLPKGVERQEHDVPGEAGLKVILYGAERRDSYYALSYTDVPEGTAVDINAAVEGSASNMGGVTVDKEPLTYKGFEALDARITGARSNGIEGTAFTRLVVTPGRLYQVMTIVKGKDKPVSETHRLIRESLELS